MLINHQPNKEPMKTKKLNVGQNRGKSRVWIENGPLTEYGWTRGTRYTFVCQKEGSGWARLNKDTSGKRKVAGTDTRPIIDLCNNQVAEWTQGAPKVSIEFTSDYILISPIH